MKDVFHLEDLMDRWDVVHKLKNLKLIEVKYYTIF